MTTRLSLLCLTPLLLALLSLIGCDRATQPPDSARSSSQSNATQPSGERANQSQRLVTLAPALTKMVKDLGAADRLVGVAKNDAVAPAEVPIVGTYNNINTEALLHASPTHVLMITAKQQVPQRLRTMADRGRFKLVTYPYPRQIEVIGRILHHPATTSAKAQSAKTQPATRANGEAQDTSPRRPPGIGQVLNRADKAAELKHQLYARLDRLKDLTRDWPEPKVLLVINPRSMLVTGPGSVNHQLLKYVSARNAAGDAPIPAISLNREALLAKQPEAIVLLDPGSPPLTEGDGRLASFRGLSIPAVQRDRIALLNDPLILLPSTNLPQTAEALAKAIHPDRRDAIEQAMQSAE